MLKASLSDNNIIFDGLIDIKASEFDKANVEKNIHKFKENICSEAEYIKALKHGYSIEYDFYSSDNVNMLKIITAPVDCGIAQQSS